MDAMLLAIHFMKNVAYFMPKIGSQIGIVPNGMPTSFCPRRSNFRNESKARQTLPMLSTRHAFDLCHLIMQSMRLDEIQFSSNPYTPIFETGKEEGWTYFDPEPELNNIFVQPRAELGIDPCEIITDREFWDGSISLQIVVNSKKRSHQLPFTFGTCTSPNYPQPAESFRG